MAMLRILFLQRDPYPLHQPDVSVLFGKYLPRHGIRTDLVSVSHDCAAGTVPWRGGSLHLRRLDDSGVFRRLARLAHCVRTILTQGQKCDIIQVRNDALLGILSWCYARLTSKKFYFWMSFPYPENDRIRAREQGLSLGLPRLVYITLRSYTSYAFQYHVVMPLADFSFVQSLAMKREMERKGLRADKMHPVPMGLDLDDLALMDPPKKGQDKAPQHKQAQRYRISYLGALDKVRRPDLLLEVLRRVQETFPEATLHLIGDAKERPDREWLERKAAESGLGDSVEISGWVGRQRAWEMARACAVSVCALPDDYIFNSMSPTKLVELLALKIPVVATAQPEHEELLGQNERGLVVPYDPAAIAEAVVDVFSNPSLAAQRSEAGQKYACTNRSYDVIANNLATLYHSLHRGVRHA